MFNLGNDDKEKLKENMEEIKNLVNNQGEEVEENKLSDEKAQQNGKPDFSEMNQEAAEQSSFPGQAGDKQATIDQKENATENKKIDSQNPQNPDSNQNQFNSGPTEVSGSKENEMKSNPSRFKSGQDPSEDPGKNSFSSDEFSNSNKNNQPDKGFQQGEENVERDNQSNQDSRVQSREEFSRGQSSDLTGNQSSPSEEEGRKDRGNRAQEPKSSGRQTPRSADFSKGKEDPETIFLTVDHFDQLQDRIEEMRYLSEEIGDVVDHLEAGVSEDKRTENEAQQLLEDFSNRRGEVEEIVSSQEE